MKKALVIALVAITGCGEPTAPSATMSPLAGPSLAKIVNERTTETVPVSYTFEHPCAAEFVLLEGEARYTVAVQTDDKGTSRYTIRTTQKLDGFGVDLVNLEPTGSTYKSQIRDALSDFTRGVDHLDTKQSFTWKIQGQGAPDFYMKQTVRFRIHNGEVTKEDFEVTTRCK